MAREGGKDRGVLLLNGVWYARFYVEGKEVREKADNKTQTKALYGKRKAAIREGKYFPKEKSVRTAFKDLASDYLVYSSLHHKRQGDDIPRVQTWLDAFGSSPAEDVKPSRVEEVMATLKADGMGPATIHRRLTVLKAIFNRAEKAGIIAKNPIRNVSPPRYDNSLVRYLDKGQETRLFNALPVHLHPVVTVALYTGCRQGELLKLEWRDINFDQKMFLNRDTKAGNSRWTPINSLVQGVLVKLAEKDHEPTDKVFAVGHCKSLSRSFAVAVRKAGLAPFRFHDLRHTFASRLAMNGANDRTLQTLGGWKTPRMLLRYAHLGPSHLQEAVEELTRPKLTVSESLPKIENG
ncbi:MAG: tyrosine-type recombinase/integrase [Leptospirillia bacterium]